MESKTLEAAPRGILARLAHAPDLFVIAGWTALICCAAALRVNFIGDGVRHLAPILAESRPATGEPRWLLFPPFLFAIIKPLQIAGLVNSVKDAVRVFLALDVLAGVFYLLLLRQWLRSRSVSPASRAGALLIAGMTVPLLRFSSDIVEAIVPATIALAGLVYLASRPLAKIDRGLCVAAAAIAFAALLYQGIVLAVALVPCAIPRGASLRARTIVAFCAILAMTPLVMFATIVAGGSSPRTAIHLMLTGEENTLLRNQMATHRLPIWQRPIAAISIGPARSIIEIPDNRGFRRGLQMLPHRDTFTEGAADIGGCLLALVMVAMGAVVVARRGEWQIAVAYAGILLLPVVRGYAYLKFYVLMPAVVALVAAASPPAIVLGAGALAGSFNGVYLARDIAQDRRLSHDIAPFYQGAGASACWLTTGWGPPIFGWQGSLCSMSHALKQAHTDQVEAMIAENNAAMVGSLRDCFCNSSAVYTDDFTLSGRDSVTELANYYRFDGVDLNQLLWSPQGGTTAFDMDGIVILQYSRPSQLDICDRLKTRRPAD